jgi:hypothetical protein
LVSTNYSTYIAVSGDKIVWTDSATDTLYGYVSAADRNYIKPVFLPRHFTMYILHYTFIKVTQKLASSKPPMSLESAAGYSGNRPYIVRQDKSGRQAHKLVWSIAGWT